jgi:hypothetical protein
MVASTKILKIYHSLIDPIHHSLLSPAPSFPGIVLTHHFPIHIHVYTLFALCSHSQTLSPPPPIPLVPTSPDRTCSALLFSDFVKEKQQHFCLFNIATKEPSTVAHNCNPSYSGGRDQEDPSSKPVQGKSFTRSYLRKKKKKKKKPQNRVGVLTQSVGPEVKPQFLWNLYTIEFYSAMKKNETLSFSSK